jgi:hypothetical protein
MRRSDEAVRPAGKSSQPARYIAHMASWDDVRQVALALPETAEQPSHGRPSWRVRGKLFVWERPLRASDLTALGEGAPVGPILGARVEHLGAKEALLADDPQVYFTTPHFGGYSAVLVALERISLPDLQELIVDAWAVRAPKRLVAAFLGGGVSAVESWADLNP